MDVLTLCGLQYHANHGYYENERREGNDFEIDLIFYANLDEAGSSDDLSQTIDYQQAERIVCQVMEGPPINLIETLATKIGNQLFNHFSVTQKLKVRIRKLHPPIKTDTTYAQIERTWTRL